MKISQPDSAFRIRNNAMKTSGTFFCRLILCGFIMFTSCDGFLCGSSSGSSSGSSNPVKTGEEVLFNADDFPEFKSAISNPMFAKYKWSFGDSKGPVVEARSVTYTFTNPGEYTVTLEVTPATHLGDGGTPDDYDDDLWTFNDSDTVTFKKTVVIGGKEPYLIPQVSAKPVLYLSFNDSIQDSSGGNAVLTWRDGAAGGFTDGISGRAVDLSGGKALQINPVTFFAGRGEFTISFRAKKKDLTQETNCVLWQGTDNPHQPIIRCIIGQDYAATRPVEVTNIYTMCLTGTQTGGSIFNDPDTNWHHYAFTFSSSKGRTALYRDGVLLRISTVDGVLKSAYTSPLYIGYGESYRDGKTSTHTFNGYIDELKIYDCELTERDLTSGFDVVHADFHGHTAQYIVVTVPGEINEDAGGRLYATVSGGGLSSPVIIADKTGLQEQEKFLLRNSDLPGSGNNYCLNIQLLNSSGKVVFENNESFQKTYNGYPAVGIDENNAIRINGELFFPVTPWGIGGPAPGHYDDIDNWVDNKYINALYGQGFWPPPWTAEGYRTYLDYASLKSVRVIGPATRWDGLGNLLNYGEGNYPFSRCTDITKLRTYVETMKNHEANMMWQWTDEPELYGVEAHQLRSWTFASHQLDPQHLVATNFMGHPYSSVNGAGSFWEGTRRNYTLGYNSLPFGQRRPVADVLGVDYYPFDAVSAEMQDTMNRLGTVLDTIRNENLDLMPVISCVETSDASNTGDVNHRTPWKPTVEQLRMITWFNVVHEVKGILWFHYFNGEDSFSTPEANLAFMNRFTQQITALTPVVLGPKPSGTVSITGITGSSSGRVDTMLRYYNGKSYLFAVRVSEFAVQPNTSTAPPPAADTSNITVTFNLSSGITGKASDYEGARSDIAVNSGSFSDVFEPFAVRIYIIE